MGKLISSFSERSLFPVSHGLWLVGEYTSLNTLLYIKQAVVIHFFKSSCLLRVCLFYILSLSPGLTHSLILLLGFIFIFLVKKKTKQKTRIPPIWHLFNMKYFLIGFCFLAGMYDLIIVFCFCFLTLKKYFSKFCSHSYWFKISIHSPCIFF